ncbi:MAG TPA: hypothetical protein PK762_03995 [Candidatus Kapabacteria bacterium]|mgnify:FL=1|nr:hypothetical protein [Candidatus Kapabacteria bacterium]
MNTPLEIGAGTNAITNQFQKKYEMYRPSSVSKNKNIQLRQGEIVQGKILKIYSQKEAEVRLPIGDLKAEFSGKLKPGDTLFFKVDSVSPSLVLKIYAVSQKIAGRILDNKEILRILDLPDEDIFNEIIEFSKSKNLVISKIDVLNVYNGLKLIDSKSFENLTLSDIFKIISFFIDYSIELNNNSFEKLKGNILGAKFLEERIEKLVEFLNTLPKTKAIESIFNFFEKLEQSSNSEKILFFNINSKETNFYSLLTDLFEKSGLPPIQEQLLQNSVKPLLNAIEGQLILNLYAALNYTPFFFLIPYLDKKKWRFYQLILKKRKSKNNNKTSAFNFKISLNSGHYDSTTIKGEDIESILDLEIFAESPEFRSILNENLEELKRLIIKNNFLPNKIEFLQNDEFKLNIANDLSEPTKSNISVVV